MPILDGYSGKVKRKEEKQMRENLKNARKEKGLTQQAVADHLGMSLRQYQRIEDGVANGTFKTWDSLEDLFNIHQRKLREIL